MMGAGQETMTSSMGVSLLEISTHASFENSQHLDCEI